MGAGTKSAYATAGDGAICISPAGLPFGVKQKQMQIPRDVHRVSVLQYRTKNKSPCLILAR
jgi:hypothetical protein